MREFVLFNRKVFFKDVVIIFIIVALPFLFYLYRLVPLNKEWETIFFDISFDYFDDAQTFMWTLLTKILTFIILSIWFITCKHWWRYAILIPVIIESYKIFEVINSDFKSFDNEFINSIPFTTPIILILVYVANKLNYYSQYKNLSSELDKEINELLYQLSVFKEGNFRSLKNDLMQLRSEKESMDPVYYLKKLMSLRENLTKL